MSLEDAITNIRGYLVPQGYSPCPFRWDTPESVLDKLRSLVAMYKFYARTMTFQQLTLTGDLDDSKLTF